MARSHPVDVHVGARMRQRRTLLGMSQEKLGTAVGLTFQQIQKYEKGKNRIPIARLPLLAFNVNLGTKDVEIAKKIAKAIRFQTGGLRYVNGDPSTPPARANIALTDCVTGLYAALGAMMALIMGVAATAYRGTAGHDAAFDHARFADELFARL